MAPPFLLNTCGLLAAAPVKWLLENEPEVRNEVRKFIRGERDTNIISVATPPSFQETVTARRSGRDILFPEIRLTLRMVMNHSNGPHVEVTCTEPDMEVIVAMAIAKREMSRAALLRQTNLAAGHG